MARCPAYMKPKKYTPAFCEKEAEALIEYTENTALPMLKEFILGRSYLADKVGQMRKVSDKFNEAVERLMYKQETTLVKAGLSNKSNPAVTIFCLKNNHGWSEKNVNMNINNDGKDFINDFFGLDKQKEPEQEPEENGERI